MFCAHLDTVPHEGQIEVVIQDGVFRSRRRDDPRRRQQGRGGGLHGAGGASCRPAARRSGSSCCSPWPRSRDCGGQRRSTPRRCAPRAASCSTTPSPVGEVIVTLADPAKDPRRLHRRRGARRHPARGRQQRDRRRRGRDLPDGAGPPRSEDHRQRRPDLRGHLRQRRSRPLLDPRRGAQPRRGAGRRGGGGDRRRLRLGGQRARVRRRRADRGAVPRLQGASLLAGARARRGRAARRRRRAAADLDRRRQRCQRAAPRRL